MYLRSEKIRFNLKIYLYRSRSLFFIWILTTNRLFYEYIGIYLIIYCRTIDKILYFCTITVTGKIPNVHCVICEIWRKIYGLRKIKSIVYLYTKRILWDGSRFQRISFFASPLFNLVIFVLNSPFNFLPALEMGTYA